MSKPDSMSRSMSAALGIVGGLIAGALFKRTWKLVAGQDDTPDAGDLDRGWAEILIAAAIQGAIAGAVKAALNHGYLVHRQDDESGTPDPRAPVR
jgi:uncharacterized membrane protein YeaQ/YmgE (transglycosylase-associated protein family)